MITAELESLAALAARPLRPTAGIDGGGGGGVDRAGDAGMAALEQAVRAAMLHVGAVVLEELLDADPGYRGPRIACGDGHTARFIGYRDKSIDTVVGRIRLRRAYYHCAGCGRGVVPRDVEVGVAGRSCSPGLAGACARAGSAMPFAAAATLVGELAGIEVGAKRLERVAEASGAAVAETVDAQAAEITAGRVAVLPPPGNPDMLYIAVDGTGVPMRPDETAGRAGKYPDGRARTREVKLACVFTQTGCDSDGHPVRDAGSTSYVATFAPADRFGALACAEATRRGSGHIRQLVVLGDGAPWTWNQATAHWPEATQIVDLYHAREHLYEIAGLLADTLGDDLEAWTAERLAELDAGRIDALVAAAGRPLACEGKCHIVDKALPYFQRNAHRMQYARFRELGMFVGSGTVEAGCKSIIGARLKQSGMRWSLRGASDIIALRCAAGSGRWDHIGMPGHNQTAAA